MHKSVGEPAARDEVLITSAWFPCIQREQERERESYNNGNSELEKTGCIANGKRD